MRTKCREPYFATFRWTKITPGLEPVITDSGALESEQPIHRVCEKKMFELRKIAVVEKEDEHEVFGGIWQSPERSWDPP